MSDAYRDELTSLHARAEKLEEDLARRDAELGELRRKLAEQDAVFARLKGVLTAGPPSRSRRWLPVTAMGLAAVALGGAWLVTGAARGPRALPIAEAAASPPPAAAAPTPVLRNACEKPGVHLTVDCEDADALATGDRDLAGHKYRRDGTRTPWFTVNGGPLYVHAYGDALQGDVGTSKLTLLTIMTKGEAGGYALARGGRSLLEVTSSDGKRIVGRFEADVSKVADTTREPPFGTPVVRARGTFCLPAMPPDPKDTGP